MPEIKKKKKTFLLNFQFTARKLARGFTNILFCLILSDFIFQICQNILLPSTLRSIPKLASQLTTSKLA